MVTNYCYFRKIACKTAKSCKTNIPTEELLRISFEELVARPQADFQKALEYVLETYKELYKRLA
jgi:hypothetical protein